MLKKSDVFSAIFILELLELRDRKANRGFLRSIFRKKIIRRTHGEVSSRNEILLAEPFFTLLYKHTSNIYDALAQSLLSTNHNLIETYDITVPELRASLARDSKDVGNAFKESLLPEYIYTLCVKRIILDNPSYAPQVRDITISKSSNGVRTKNKIIVMLRSLPLLAKKFAVISSDPESPHYIDDFAIEGTLDYYCFKNDMNYILTEITGKKDPKTGKHPQPLDLRVEQVKTIIDLMFMYINNNVIEQDHVCEHTGINYNGDYINEVEHECLKC